MRDGLHLSSAVPKIQWYSNPHCPTAIRPWETLCLYSGYVPNLRYLFCSWMLNFYFWNGDQQWFIFMAFFFLFYVFAVNKEIKQ